MFVLQCFEKEVISRVLLNVILTKRRRRGETRRRNSCRGGGDCRENGGGRGVKITCTSGKHRGLTPTCPLPSLLKNTTILKCSLLFYDEIKVRLSFYLFWFSLMILTEWYICWGRETWESTSCGWEIVPRRKSSPGDRRWRTSARHSCPWTWNTRRFKARLETN